MRFLSPAKINLFFKLLSKRDDGYHNIASLFQAVSIFDVLTISLAEEDRFSCSDTSLPLDEKNLCLRALALFRQKTGASFSCRIHLEKNIPIEAGLGGGSSNAATTLFALNKLLGSPVSEKELMSWGASIGSDVPFFFSRGTAFCTGRGEEVHFRGLPSITKKFWAVKIPEGLSTPLVFKTCKIKPQKDSHNLSQALFSAETLYKNDLEESAFFHLPKLAQLKEELLRGGCEEVFLTGTGSALVCVGERIPAVSFPIKCYPLAFIRRKENRWYE